MPQLAKTRAIVLHRRLYKEGNALVWLLKEDGSVLHLQAHGIHAKSKASALLIEPASLISLDYYIGKNGYASLKEGCIERRFEECKKHYSDLLILSYHLELLRTVCSYGSSPALFKLLHGALDALSFPKEEHCYIVSLSVFFQLRLLKFLGILGAHDSCSHCESLLQKKAHWKLPEASFACISCFPQANHAGFLATQIIALAHKQTFCFFKRKLLEENVSIEGMPLHMENKEAFLLRIWRSFHLCLEHFCGRPIVSYKALAKQWQQQA